MATGDNLKRDGRPSLLQIRYLIELKKLQPVKRGFQVVIAERCHVSRPGINKSLKKAIEQGMITQYYTFTDYGEEWIKSYENLIGRLEKYLDDIDIPESEKEKHIRMMVEDMDPFLVESILSAHEELVKPQNRKYKSLNISGRKIYAVFTVLGICLTLVFLTFLHVNPLILIWGTFFLFSLIIIVLIA